jgi:hypothetical protein
VPPRNRPPPKLNSALHHSVKRNLFKSSGQSLCLCDAAKPNQSHGSFREAECWTEPTRKDPHGSHCSVLTATSSRSQPLPITYQNTPDDRPVDREVNSESCSLNEFTWTCSAVNFDMREIDQQRAHKRGEKRRKSDKKRPKCIATPPVITTMIDETLGSMHATSPSGNITASDSQRFRFSNFIYKSDTPSQTTLAARQLIFNVPVLQ